VKLLVDMNLSPRWVTRLASIGIPALHWSNVGARNASDREIMAYASVHQMVVLTHDLDFGAILAATQAAGPSVMQVRTDDVSPEAIGEQVVNALTQLRQELTEGALITVDPVRARLRVLPLRPRD
jgi:predicted nuclease of predicted toxin-antitoxin system